MSALPVPVSDTLPLSRIVKGANPRRYFDRQKHIELVASVRLRGILQPIVVRPVVGDLFEIVCGERRYRAALEVYGSDGDIPVVIRVMSDDEALEAAIDENDARDDASETEQADAAARRLAACGNDRAEAARRLGWSRAKLDRRLALASLSETVKSALDERRIKVGHAELLAAVPGDKQDKALETILGANLDVAKTRELLMRVTQDLGHASFDKSECTTCPFNSATQRALFDTHVEDGHCTNATCFQLKTEAVEQMLRDEREEIAARLARDATDDPEVDDERPEDSGVDDEAASRSGEDRTDGITSAKDVGSGAMPPKPVKPVSTTSSVRAPTVDARYIAARTKEYREASWRTAVARTLAGDPAKARTAILVAALSGTLSQIKPETLTSRAALLVGETFPSLHFAGKIAHIDGLSDGPAGNVLAVIGAAYARDVGSFDHVADLARAFAVDLRDSWQVDRAFLERYTKAELTFIARECGLVAHMGDKAFAKLLGATKADLLSGMIHRFGFDWAGRLPSAMTLDGTYAPPLTSAGPTSVTAIAA